MTRSSRLASTPVREWRRLRRFCTGQPQYGLNIPASEYLEDGIRFLRTTDISEKGTIRLDDSAKYVDEAIVPDEYRLGDRDILFSRSGTLGRCLIFTGGDGAATFAGYLVRFRPLQSTDARYLAYCSQAGFFKAAIQADAITSTISNFNAGRYGNLELPMWPLGVQTAIADYLDRETAYIDALIAKKELLLNALRESLPAAASMILLGTIEGPGHLHAKWPASWKRIPFRWLFSEVDERSTDGSEELMSVSQTRGVIAQSELGDRHQFAETLAGYKICRAGDLVINRMWVYYGALGVAPGVGLVSPDYSVFRSRGELRSDLASYILRTPPYVGEMTRLVRGVGSAFQGSVRKPRLHPRELGQIVMPAPPTEDQDRLVDELAQHQNLVDRKVRLVERSLGLLRERRETLIGAAVTGQLDSLEAA